MSYDLMNRRDTVTAHHSSISGAAQAVQNYLDIGAPASKINLGFAYYAKYFTTAGDCTSSPLNCPIVVAEDPITGKDTLTSGAWTFEKSHMQPVNGSVPVSNDGTCGAEKGTKCASGCCSQYGNCGTSKEHCSGACQHAFGTGCTDADIAGSWQLAAANGVTDNESGGQYFFDAANKLFWTWDTTQLMARKFQEIVAKNKLGGVMAWSLGEGRKEGRKEGRREWERRKVPPWHLPLSFFYGMWKTGLSLYTRTRDNRFAVCTFGCSLLAHFVMYPSSLWEQQIKEKIQFYCLRSVSVSLLFPRDRRGSSVLECAIYLLNVS
jgi:hypothetical protein